LIRKLEPSKRIFKLLARENLYLLISVVLLGPIYYYFREGKVLEFDYELLKIFAGILLLMNVPSLIIISSYFSENNTTKLEIDIDGREISISQKGTLKTYKFSEIDLSVYHLGKYYQNRFDNAMRRKMLSSDLGYWELKFNNGDTYYLSSLMIDFLHEAPIVINTQFRFRLFPFIDKSNSKEAIQQKALAKRAIVARLTIQYERKSEQELIDILENRVHFQTEAIEAARNALEKKNVG